MIQLQPFQRPFWPISTMSYLQSSNHNPPNVSFQPCPAQNAPVTFCPMSHSNHVLPAAIQSHIKRHFTSPGPIWNDAKHTQRHSPTISYLKRSTYNRFNVAFGPDPTYDSIPTCPMSTSKHCPTYIPVTACPTSPLNHVKPSTIKLMSDHVVRLTPNHSPHYVSFQSCSTHKDPVPTGSPWLFNPVLPTTI